MLYVVLAQAVVALHFLFVLFVPLGGFLALRWRRVAWFHIPAAAWGTLIEFGMVWCPLTPLEKSLLVLAGRRPYETGFIAHYIAPLLYPEGLTPTIQWGIGLGVIALNAVVYAFVFRRRPYRGD